MKKKFIQIFYDMRTQPVVAWVTIIGTALSIFLIMTVMMMQQVKIMPIKPESNRDRMLYGKYLHEISIEENGNERSAGLAYETAKTLYDGLEGVEEISYIEEEVYHLILRGPNGKKISGDTRRTDEGFWRVFDHELIAGRYYNANEVDANTRVAVLTKSMARKLFDKDKPIGEHFELAFNDYEVIGVVEDVSKLASMSYGELYIPLDKSQVWGDDSDFGPFFVAMLIRDGVDFQSVRDQVKRRYAVLDAQAAPEGFKTVYHESPYDQPTIAAGVDGSNVTPDTSGGRTMRIVIYVILLLVPAINLSTMLHSRLRRRVSELGVRRAFGCTRCRIMTDIVAENLIVTVIGGLIGLGIGILFALFYDGIYTTSEGEAVRPALGVLLNWQILLSAFGVCFILNILSASVPAWQASRLNPVEAINAR